MIELTIVPETFPLAEAFTISRGSRSEAHVLTVTLTDGQHRGRGECFPYARYGETHSSVIEQIESIRQDLTHSPSVTELQSLLPPGAARNAVDCALWELNARRQDTSVWKLAGLTSPVPVTSVYTLSLDEPSVMQKKAEQHAFRPLLKIKLGGDDDIARLKAVRAGAPDAAIVVDANEGWTADIYQELAPTLIKLGVQMVEQPLPAAEDQALLGLQRPLTVCADESCHDTSTLPGLKGKYDMVNIKLDKTGGLTEALRVRDAAQREGFKVMVGCMVASSLAMAPAMLVSQGVDLVDLDAPLLLAKDRSYPLAFNGSKVNPPDPRLWG